MRQMILSAAFAFAATAALAQAPDLVRVRGNPPEAALNSMLRGLDLADGVARFDSLVVQGRSEGHSWYRVGLHEGRNREVRRLFESQNITVTKLQRTQIGKIKLGELKPGKWRTLTPAEIKTLISDL